MQKRKAPAAHFTWAKQRKSLDNDDDNAKHLRRSAVDEEAEVAGGSVSWSDAQQAALDDQLLQQLHVPAADVPNNERFCNLLYKAVAFRDDAQLQRLVASGADINEPLPGLGLTPLQYCAAKGTCIKAVLAAGARLDDRNAQGLTALMLATSDNKVTIARALLEAGASVSLADNRGWTVLHWAASTAWYGLNVKELIEAGADIAAASNSGDTPLHEAVRRKAWHTAAMLVAAGARVDQMNGSQQTPLDLAAGCPQMAKLLQARLAKAGASPPGSSDAVPADGGKGSAAYGQEEHQSQPTALPPSLPTSSRDSPGSLCIASPPAARPTAAQQNPAATLQQQLQLLRPLLEQCRAAGQLDLDAAADYRTTFTHWLSAEQRQEDLDLFAELAAAGKQAKLGECVRRVAAMQQQRQRMASTRQGVQAD